VDAVTVVVATTEREIELRPDRVIVGSVDDVRLVTWVEETEGEGVVEGLKRVERESDGDTEALCVTRDTVALADCDTVAIKDALKSPVVDSFGLPLVSIEGVIEALLPSGRGGGYNGSDGVNRESQHAARHCCGQLTS